MKGNQCDGGCLLKKGLRCFTNPSEQRANIKLPPSITARRLNQTAELNRLAHLLHMLFDKKKKKKWTTGQPANQLPQVITSELKR